MNPYDVDSHTVSQRWMVVGTANNIFIQSCFNPQVVISVDANAPIGSPVKLQFNLMRSNDYNDKNQLKMNKHQQWLLEKPKQITLTKPKYVSFGSPCYIYSAEQSSIHFCLNSGKAFEGNQVVAWNSPFSNKRHELFILTQDGFIETVMDRTLVLDCGTAQPNSLLCLQRKRVNNNLNQKWMIMKSTNKNYRYIASAVNPALVVCISGQLLVMQWSKNSSDKDQKWLLQKV